MFEATRPFLFFDYLRVPYSVAPVSDAPRRPSPGPQVSLEGLWPEHALSRRLYWPGWSAHRSTNGSSGVRPQMYQLRGRSIFCRLVPEAVSAGWRRAMGTAWSPIEPVTDHTGAAVASVWCDREGSILLPFDPGEIIQNDWSEAYRAAGEQASTRLLKSALMHAYYRVKPAVPRAQQIRMRRVFSSLQRKAAFPDWPIEDSLHDFFAWLFAVIVDVAGAKVPWIDPWPEGYSWAMVLTHDVETAEGCASIEQLRAIERAHGYRSSWNFVPERYAVDAEILAALRKEGCEIGVHGLRHDGRDLSSARSFRRRSPRMRAYAEQWQAVGFRSPATQRRWDLMPGLGFTYDSSYPDTDPYEPQAGGCCSFLPFMNQDLVEIPITLPQDHTLFVILEGRHGDIWIEKTEHLRSRRGMAVALTHPDYAGDGRITGAYERLLEHFRDDRSAWRPLPAELAAWWIRRSRSVLEPGTDGGWTISGPASTDGSIRVSERLEDTAIGAEA
jgi:peptidoglycan/xylan/chitin deacetylase (PgdA/CDA1 family)